MEKFETPIRPLKRGSSERVQPRKSPSHGSRNAHASKTTKRGAAGFVVVSTAMKTWASPLFEFLWFLKGKSI